VSQLGPGGGGQEGEEVRSAEAVLRRVRAHLRRRGGAVALLGLAGVLGGVLTAAWIVAAEGWRPGSWVPLILLALAAGVSATLVGVLVHRLRGWTDPRTLSAEMERRAGIPAGSLRAQIELDRSPPAGVSGSLIRAGAARILGPLDRSPSELSGEPGAVLGRVLRWTSVGTGAVLLLLVGLAALSPDRARVAWGGLLNPSAVLAAGTLGPLSLEPGDTALPRGSVPEIRVGAPGRVEVVLHWQAVGEPLQSRTLDVDEGTALGRLPPLESPVTYWASAADGARTGEALLRPDDPLLLSDLTLQLEFPAYTGLPTETFHGPPGDLQVPEGTTVRVEGRMDGPGDEVRLRSEAGGNVAMRLPVADGRFRGGWRPVRSQVLRWEVDAEEEHAVLPPPFALTVEPDRPPEVALPIPGGDGELPVSLRLPLLLEASDDHGLAWVEVEATRVTTRGGAEEPVTDQIPLEGRRDVSLRPVLDVSDWDLRPGDYVVLRARAVDNSPREQEALTPEYRLRVPGAAAMREAARDRIEQAGDRVEELARRADREARQLRDLGREARMGAQRGGGAERFQEREDLRSAAQEDLQAREELQRLQDEMEEARRSLEGLGDEDGGLGERMRELTRLLAELADPEQQGRMQELMERLASGETPDAATELEELAEAREALRDRLEEALERLRREALEQAFQGSEEELRALAQEQEALAQRMDEPEAAARQDSIAARTEAMEERLEELARRLQEQGEPDAASQTGEVSRDLSEAREAMERAAEAARSGDSSGAGEEAEEAAQQAREAVEEMEQARMEWLEEWEERIREALRQGAEDALALARRQGELRERFRQGAGAVERSRLQGEETALLEGVGHLATRIGVATRQAPAVGRQVLQALGEAHLAMERTVEALERAAGARGQADEAAARAVQGLNRAAILALLGMEQVGQTPESSALEDLLDELDALAGEQESINEQAQAMSAEGDTEGAQARMEEMAAAQDAVASAMEQLARQMGGEWTPGDLEEMAAEARELARELDQGRLDAETLQRQEELLDRLLGAGRMLERDAPTEEREGRTAEDFERSVVQPLPDGLLRGNFLPLPAPDDLARLTPAERRLVLEYFERLNRRPDGGGGR
jgi:hypothetical protein